MTITQHDADQMEVESMGEEMTLDHLADIIESVPEAERFSGSVSLVMRRNTKQAWSQAKPFTVLKDMTPERVAQWLDGMNEVAGFEQFRAV